MDIATIYYIASSSIVGDTSRVEAVYSVPFFLFIFVVINIATAFVLVAFFVKLKTK